ncbi:MAG: NAD(P)/FAD-dependent oxidoreductase [Chloroflexi bacterium]|nr:NAD(P)/FAD-dependent oxidoreductase [Chloroflexota bacterium]
MRYVIIGGGAAGVAAAQTARRLDKDSSITLIGGEPRVGYYRPLIPHLIHDKFLEDRFLRPPGLFSSLKVEVLSPVKAQAVDVEKKVVVTSRKHSISYDRLLLVTGGQAIVPDVKGMGAEDVHVLRSYKDGVKLAGAAKQGKQAVVIGGGRVGTLTALALGEAGMEVTIVEMLGHIMPQQFDAAGASIVASAVQAKGIRLQTGRQVKEVRHKGTRKTVVTDNGQELPCDLLVAAVGVRPNLELARQIGARVDRGVIVDSNLRTSVPDVYAAGDLVQLVDLATGQDFVSGTWTNAVDMGNCAGSNVVGVPRKYAGSFFIQNAVEIAGVPTIAVGAIHGQDPHHEVHARQWDGVYHKFVFLGNRLVGMLLIGDVDKAGIYRALIREGADISTIKDKIVSRTLNYAAFLKRLAPETKQYAVA